jgi:hypothetical protein
MKGHWWGRRREWSVGDGGEKEVDGRDEGFPKGLGKFLPQKKGDKLNSTSMREYNAPKTTHC